MELHSVLDFVTEMGEEMTGTLGSKLTGAKNVDLRGYSRLCLLLQFENENSINNRFTRSASNATK